MTMFYPLLAMTLSLITLNTGGCSAITSNCALNRYFDNLPFSNDVVFLQETYNLTQNCPCWQNWNLYTPLCAPGTAPGTGVTTLVKQGIDVLTSSVLGAGHLLFIQIKAQDTVYNLYNLLVPQNDALAVITIDVLSSHCGQLNEGVIVVGGDFNCTLNPLIDRVDRPAEHRPRLVQALTKFLNDFGLCDVWRRINPLEKKFTWMRKRASNPSSFSRARLDRFYAPPDILPSIRACKISPCSLSDHSSLNLCLRSSNPQHKGSAYWHFNNSLLDDENYRGIIRNFWTNWQKEKFLFDDVCKWWDLGKSQIKTLTQTYSSKMAREKRETFIRLNSHLANLQSAPDITPTAQRVLEEQRKELNLLLRHQARGALVRSRFQHINEIDTSSTYFFNLKKSHSKSKTLLCIRLRDGELTENPEKINYRC